MAKATKPQSGSGKGTIEDAAKALRESHQGEQQEPQSGGEAGTDGEESEKEGLEGNGNTGEAGTEPGEKETEAEQNNEGATDKGTISFDVPVPSDEELKKFATMVCSAPGHLEAFRRTIKMVDAMMAEKNKPAKKSVEEIATENYQRILSKYGKDFVTASQGTNRMYFSRASWNQMGNNKNGWVEVTKAMPEVDASQL